MPTKRALLEQLSRPELQEIATRFELEVADRRSVEALVDAASVSPKANLTAILGDMSGDRLKELCRALDRDDRGKEKTALIERLLESKATSHAAEGSDSHPAEPPSSQPAKAPRRSRPTQPKNGGGDLGFEKTLFLAADKLRNNMDAAEYKHVVLGLVFLKYISDAFEELHSKLVKQADEGADPEERDEYRAERVFWVPKEARWAEIQKGAKQPEIGQKIDAAMEAVERDNPSLKGVLAKNYGRPSPTERHEALIPSSRRKPMRRAERVRPRT